MMYYNPIRTTIPWKPGVFGNDAICTQLQTGSVFVTINEAFCDHQVLVDDPAPIGRNGDADGTLLALVRRAHTCIGMSAYYSVFSYTGLTVYYHTPRIELVSAKTPAWELLLRRFAIPRRTRTDVAVQNELPRARKLLVQWECAKVNGDPARLERATKMLRTFVRHRTGHDPHIQQARLDALRIARRLTGVGTGYVRSLGPIERPGVPSTHRQIMRDVAASEDAFAGVLEALPKGRRWGHREIHSYERDAA